MRPRVTMRQALDDPNLLGSVLAGDTWAAWRVILIAIMGEPLSENERALWLALTDRPAEPLEPVEEFWGIVGRRGGKTRAMAVLAAYLACLCDWSDVLVPGERGRLVLVAQNQRQASIALGYISAILSDVPILARLVEATTADTISLRDRIDVEVRAASFRGLRGVTAIAAIADEIAFWRSAETSQNPDSEILAALRPALATTRGPLIAISSPYARRGELFATHRAHFGAEGDPRIVVARATSRQMNPSLPEALVERALARDPAAARAEWLAEFRDDIEAFVTRELVEACIVPGRDELPRLPQTTHHAFVDPSGGSADAMTLAIAHRVDGVVRLCCLREQRPPFSPAAVVAEFAAIIQSYGELDVTGDAYSGEWVREAFRQQGITYRVADRTRSELYRDLLPLLTSGTVELLESERLVGQLVGLERRALRSGREVIDHGPGAHDDLANAAAGAIALAAEPDQPTAVIGSYDHFGAETQLGSWSFSGLDYIRSQRRDN